MAVRGGKQPSGLDRGRHPTEAGPLVAALCPYDCLVLFPVTPLTVAKSRDAFPPSRATDGPTDAARQVTPLLQHRATLPARSPQSPTMRAWVPRVAHRRRLGGDNVRLTQRLTSALTHSFPQVLAWVQEQAPAILGDVRSRWPTLPAAPRARRATLAACFQAHHVRSADVIATRLQALTSATPLTMDAGVMTPTAWLVHALVSQRRVTLPASKDCDDAMAQRAQAHPACPLFDTWPGAGAVFAPRLLGAFGEQRERDPSAAAHQT